MLIKRAFFDSIYLRYCWDLKRLPIKCECSQKSTMDHALQCQTGGYVIKRHNRIRDMLANFLDDVAHGVHTEPGLQPLSGEELQRDPIAQRKLESMLQLEASGKIVRWHFLMSRFLTLSPDHILIVALSLCFALAKSRKNACITKESYRWNTGHLPQ